MTNSARPGGTLSLHTWLLPILLTLFASQVLSLATGWVWLALVSRVAFVGLCIVWLRAMGIREATLMLVSIVLSVVVWRAGGTFSSALDLAAFFGTFIATLTAMRDVAARSGAVVTVGHYLTNQTAGRRFYATAIGGHLLGVFLNFGAISLMSPLIQKSAVHADGSKYADMERRQLSALIRGFSWVLLWAPTTLSQAVLFTIFTDVTLFDILPMGIATAILMIFIGRLYDRWEWRKRPITGANRALPAPLFAIAVVAAICVSLIAATVVGSVVFSASIAETLLFVVPVVTFTWFRFQNRTDSWVANAKELGSILSGSAPSLARSAIALGLSGYIGRLAGQALPTETLANAVNFGAVPGWLFLAALPILITLGGQIALSPIMLVVFLGEVLGSVDTLPTGQAQIVFALSVGWALSMLASPNATATLLISATSSIAPTTLTWVWNLRYGLICYAVAVIIFALIQ